jgi:hypothetical protein
MSQRTPKVQDFKIVLACGAVQTKFAGGHVVHTHPYPYPHLAQPGVLSCRSSVVERTSLNSCSVPIHLINTVRLLACALRLMLSATRETQRPNCTGAHVRITRYADASPPTTPTMAINTRNPPHLFQTHLNPIKLQPTRNLPPTNRTIMDLARALPARDHMPAIGKRRVDLVDHANRTNRSVFVRHRPCDGEPA